MEQQRQQEPEPYGSGKPESDTSFGFQLQRTAKVTVLDAAGNLASGAPLAFLLDDVFVGSATLGTEPATVSFPAAHGDLTVEVDFLGERLQHVFGRHESQYTFQLRSTAHFIQPARGEAQCPNGKTGQPCVQCKVGGKQIEICS